MSRVFIDKTGVPVGTYYLVGLLMVPVQAIFFWGLYQQFALNEYSPGNPADKGIFIGISVAMLVLTAAVFWLMASIKTEIKIADQTISYRFPPFVNKMQTITFADLKHWQITRRNRLLTGIGLRYDLVKKTKIYSTGTKYYFSLEFSDGKNLMISTGNPEELDKTMKLAQASHYE